VADSYEHRHEYLGSIKDEEFLDQLLKGSTPWTELVISFNRSLKCNGINMPIAQAR
jgi:hypothetical protein